jgi:hypothetical protein
LPIGTRATHRYWSRAFIGWCSYTEDVPLICHDVVGWEPIADQAVARALPLEKVRRAGARAVVVGGRELRAVRPRAAGTASRS